jgi:hypothetical protein
MQGTDARRRARFVRLAVAAVLALGAFACSKSSNPGPVVTSDTINIKNGSWYRIRSYSVSGADSCQAPGPDTSYVVLCSYDPGVGSDPLGLTCGIEQDGDAVTVSCSGRLQLYPCRIDYHLEGSGTVTDTTLDITMQRWTTVESGEGIGSLCDSLYADPCTTTVVTKASWFSTTGDSLCTDDAAPSVSLADALNRMLGGVAPR